MVNWQRGRSTQISGAVSPATYDTITRLAATDGTTKATALRKVLDAGFTHLGIDVTEDTSVPVSARPGVAGDGRRQQTQRRSRPRRIY